MAKKKASERTTRRSGTVEGTFKGAVDVPENGSGNLAHEVSGNVGVKNSGTVQHNNKGAIGLEHTGTVQVQGNGDLNVSGKIEGAVKLQPPENHTVTIVGDPERPIVHDHTGKVHHDHTVRAEGKIPNTIWWALAFILLTAIVIALILAGGLHGATPATTLAPGASSDPSSGSSPLAPSATPPASLGAHWIGVHDRVKIIDEMGILDQVLLPEYQSNHLTWLCPAHWLRTDDLLRFAQTEMRRQGITNAHIYNIRFVAEGDGLMRMSVWYRENGMGKTKYFPCKITSHESTAAGGIAWAAHHTIVLQDIIENAKRGVAAPASLPAVRMVPRTTVSYGI